MKNTKKAVSFILVTGALFFGLPWSGTFAQSPMECGTRATKVTSRNCADTSNEGCELQNADDFLFCVKTQDTTACWRTPVQPFQATYQRRTGECVDGICVFGDWQDVTTTFDHINHTDECGGA